MLTLEEKNALAAKFQHMAEDVYVPFSKEEFKRFGVKRGLRNDDGTGVMAGLTSVGQVVGYYISDGEKNLAEGELKYRGYEINDLVRHCEEEKRYGFEEVTYLLLFRTLPVKRLLRNLQD